ncbi:MAG: hypothetical protein DI539_29580 [Flavobacterium psychrophilum]|nr:MAG: hypothetical protein DI539_29580 [Flavobacterium psychrophilum]
MKNIIDFFDYHYYRVAKFYFKRDGIGAITALISVTSVQVWVLINILLFVEGLFYNEIEKFKYYKVIYFVIVIGVFLYNRNRYKNKYLDYRERWKNEDIKLKRNRGVIIIITIILAWSLIFINGIFFNRFK